MVKYADDSTILVTVNEDLDNSERALSHFMDWTNNNNMKCNTDKCKELVVWNRLTIQYIRLYIISSNMIMLPCCCNNNNMTCNTDNCKELAV